MSPQIAYGSWPSPIPASLFATGDSLPDFIQTEGGVVWWSRSRADQGGRGEIVRMTAAGAVAEATPDGFNARTRVHEYGGAAWWVHGGAVFANSWADQRVYRIDRVSQGGKVAIPLTPEPATKHGFRHADGRVSPDGSTVICVREHHDGAVVRNEIVAFDANPATAHGLTPAATSPAAPPAVLVTDWDFVSAPRISRDGGHLAWLAWNHPNMPWDATELWVGDLIGTGSQTRVEGAHRVAGNGDESLVQPEWGPDGRLYVVSDRSDWWNVYSVRGIDELIPVHPVAAEIGRPAWTFGQSRYLVSDTGELWMTFSDEDGAHLVCVGIDGGVHDLLVPDVIDLHQLRWNSGQIVAVASRFESEAVVVSIDVTNVSGRTPAVTVLKQPRDLGLDPSGISRPRRIHFPTADGQTAHAWFFPPAGVFDGEQITGRIGELPPLITVVHGGPTSAADPSFKIGIQFWTSRGFAVVDVDHRGSTGLGRAFRQLLNGNWGIVDVEDACAAAQWLGDQSLVDPKRLVIRGGSAGGFTTLAALATRNTFAAGASLFGVADLGALARDTHKFESRYLDKMIGPWPEAEAVYLERSPLSHLDGFDRPLLVLQGLDDEIVPPSQSEMIVDALEAKGVPHAYITFEGEGHGFRIAENIIRAVTAQMYFFSRVLKFELAETVEPVDIRFADRL